ncbi:Na+/H+ antiporter subunit E [Cupriavidus respiraculi]|uniref:Na+/H+ antiporter subunit E n=1 Tax=Cupriavidus respiraculi TaxID=195930 RepID=UPI001C98176B|nr:Na+/H+ antiporter subunit E [Cupriavidus respiraculi]MBY4947652.1 Na+/H+ antiporter subunit E [Cupriavidus respiraculi]
MLRRWFPHPWLTLVLLVVWLLLSNEISFGSVLLGGLLAWLISLRIGLRLWLSPMQLRRPDLMLLLLGRVLADILVANVHVAMLVLGRASRLRPGFVEIPLEAEHEMALTALISIVSLSPGTLCAELSEDRRCLLVHVLDLKDESTLTADIKSRYEAPLREIFVCSTS